MKTIPLIRATALIAFPSFASLTPFAQKQAVSPSYKWTPTDLVPINDSLVAFRTVDMGNGQAIALIDRLGRETGDEVPLPFNTPFWMPQSFLVNYIDYKGLGPKLRTRFAPFSYLR